MNPRLRLTLSILAVVVVVGVAITQTILLGVKPFLAARAERGADYKAFLAVRDLKTRAAIEAALPDWDARPLDADGCRFAATTAGRPAGLCAAAKSVIAYQRRRTSRAPNGLTARRILAAYDEKGNTVAPPLTFD